MDIYITPEVAAKVDGHKKVYTRMKPQVVLCITDTPRMPISLRVFRDEIWYYCPHCHGLTFHNEMLPTLLDEVKLCTKCYGAIIIEKEV